MRVLVAMSGGVDSSVAAALLKREGYDVWGVHMELHDTPSCDTNKKTCCGTQDALDARSVAEKLDIMFDVIDFRKEFQAAVVDNFISEYKAGRTPIPCTHCNGSLKFDLLLKYAAMADCDYIATGHYATLDSGSLYRAKFLDKDQTYFLWPIKRHVLDKLLFPISDYTKEEIRALARDFGLNTSDKPESMNICFVPKGDYRRVIEPHMGDCSGDIVCDTTGKVLGSHSGYYRFTIGQRRGLPSGSKPLYVTRIDPETHRVYVGNRDHIFSQSFSVSGCNFLEDPSVITHTVTRHRAQPVPCHFENNVVHCEPCIVTPGQSAVFYSNDMLVGGGWIR